jgi:hypothetical protein
MKKIYLLIDVGCVECKILGVFDTREELSEAFNKCCEDNDIPEYELRGGFHKVLGSHNKKKSTYLGSAGYFSGGQRALEGHVFPPQN